MLTKLFFTNPLNTSLNSLNLSSTRTGMNGLLLEKEQFSMNFDAGMKACAAVFKFGSLMRSNKTENA